MSISTTPIFTHDCEKCSFIGRVNGRDVYTCMEAGELSIISRFSDRGQDYRALPESICEMMMDRDDESTHPLIDALKMVKIHRFMTELGLSSVQK